MNMYDIIAKKRDNLELTGDEIHFWLTGLVSGEIPDYQTTALLMAIFLNGMTEMETYLLTREMTLSGNVMDLSSISGTKVDKHSSGGVGDKTSLLVAPIAAAAGLKVAKMSGKGLGHTGGTLDKLSAIPGFTIECTPEDFVNQVEDCGIAIIGQQAELVPADKKLYALRDVTATVNNLSLIAASIMSKKLATGADVIVLDVKYGKGAFMPTAEEAIQLADIMVSIGTHYNKKVAALITNMEQPLGLAVGNSLEVDEAVNTLKGEGPEDLRQLSVALAGEMIYQGGIKESRSDAYALANKLLDNKKAWKKFLAMVKAQGGEAESLKKEGLTHAAYNLNMGSSKAGYVQDIDALKIGLGARDLGAGRAKAEDSIHMDVGIVLNKKVGDKVDRGECLATIYADDVVAATGVGSYILDAFVIADAPCAKQELIYGIVDRAGFTPWNEIQ